MSKADPRKPEQISLIPNDDEEADIDLDADLEAELVIPED